jgi:hypothetical protein
MKKYDISVTLTQPQTFCVDLTANDSAGYLRPYKVFYTSDEFNAAMLDLGLNHETIFDMRCEFVRAQKSVCRDVDIEDDAVKRFEAIHN